MVGSLAYSSLLFCCLYSLASICQRCFRTYKTKCCKIQFFLTTFSWMLHCSYQWSSHGFHVHEGWSGEDACPCSRQVDDPARISKAQCRWEACCRGAEKEPCGSKDSRTGRAHQENRPSAAFLWLLELVLVGSKLAPLLPLPLWSISPVTVY